MVGNLVKVLKFRTCILAIARDDQVLGKVWMIRRVNNRCIYDHAFGDPIYVVLLKLFVEFSHELIHESQLGERGTEATDSAMIGGSVLEA